MKKLFDKIFSNSWLIALSSLAWFLLRTGTKPTRVIYPCQQVAKTNFYVFGLPAVLVFWSRLKKCSHYRFKVVGLSLLTIFLITGFYGLTRAQSQIKYFLYRLKRPAVYQFPALAQSGSRVVWIEDDRAIQGKSYTGGANKANQNDVDRMMDQAVMALAGTDSVAAAWAQLLPCGTNCSGKTVAIKVNFNNRTDCGTYQCPLYETVNALLGQLVNEVGISQANISLFDTQREINRTAGNYDFQGGVLASFPSVRMNPNYRDYTGGSFSWSGSNFNLSRVLADNDYLINMPLLRTHGYSGATASFKNHMGNIDLREPFHNGFFDLDNNPLVVLNNQPHIRNKTVLIVGDGLYGIGGSVCGPVQAPNLRPASLFLSADPVAVDTVMIDYLDSVGTTFCSSSLKSKVRNYLLSAQSAGLGSAGCSGSESCHFSYNNINLIECPNGNCPGTSPPPTATPTSIFTPTPTPISTVTPTPTPISTPHPACQADGDNNHLLNWFDYLEVLIIWGDEADGDPEDIDGDTKVSGLDLGWVVSGWGANCN